MLGAAPGQVWLVQLLKQHSSVLWLWLIRWDHSELLDVGIGKDRVKGKEPGNYFTMTIPWQNGEILCRVHVVTHLAKLFMRCL